MPSRNARILIGSACTVGLLAVFIFQGLDIASLTGAKPRSIEGFIINRSIRFILNDALTIGLIYALFSERKYVIFSLYLQLIELFVFLVPYFIIKTQFP